MSGAPEGLPGAPGGPDGADADDRVVDAVDAAVRFTVEHEAVRGEFVRLGPAWLALREHADYPAPVRRLVGEAAAAAVLLAATLKFDGELTLQWQGDGLVRLMVAQCTHDLRLRAVARFDAAAFDGDADPGFAALAGAGQLAVTLESGRDGARYQGIVPLAGGSLAAAIEQYFGQSEQLPTAVVLGADDAHAAGLLVQRLPQAGGTGVAAGAAADAGAARIFEAAQAALAGLAPDELLIRPVAELLRRACAGPDLRVFPSRGVAFRCRCDRERVAGVLRALGPEELESILAEQGAVSVTCEFCQRLWQFDAVDVSGLAGDADRRPPGTPLVH
jgi:molecular chaperone Hsp33